MKKILTRLLLLVVCWGNVSPATAATALDTARRITGHFAECSDIAGISVEAWDPASEEGRQYVGPLQNSPSSLFVREECLAEGINSLENLEDLVYNMLKTLMPCQKLRFRSAAAKTKLAEWVKKVNTLYYLHCSVVERADGPYLHICYRTDARVFAAFRNPELEKVLTPKERDVLSVCAQWICDNIRPGMPNMLKIKKVHDALVDNSRYTCGHCTTADIVLEGKGVCAAYTSATQLLLHMLKVDCRSVLSTPEMNHIWNIIDVNGEWYHTDVTWDDPRSSDGRDVKIYRYYFLSEAEMDMSHDWENHDIYPRTPEINRVGIFKRRAHRESGKDADENSRLTYPREKESVFAKLAESWRNEAEQRGDQVSDLAEPVVAPVAAPVDRVARSVARQSKKLHASPRNKVKTGKPEYKPIQSVEELYANLRTARDYLDGPTLEFEVKSNCPCIIETLARADFHLYVKHWNFRFDEKKMKLFLDVEHWPHIRLLRSVDNEANAARLTPEERKALRECQLMATKYGTTWKQQRQKTRDVYQNIIAEGNWKPGVSDVVKFCSDRKSGSLGYSETLHVVLSLMDIPCIMVHGRTHDHAHAWNMVRRAGRWYHASAALDAAEHNRFEHQFKYFMRCDDEVYDNLVFDTDETYQTPVKNTEKARKCGLLKPRKQPEHAPAVEASPGLLNSVL